MTATETRSLPLTLYAGATRGYAVLWGKARGSECFDATDPDALARMAERATAWSREESVYYGVCLTGAPVKPTERGKADAVVAVPGFWADVDIDPDDPRKPATLKSAADFLKSLPLKPSLVVKSGHGLHVYWLFDALLEIGGDDERRDVADLARGWLRFVNARASEHGWTFDAVFDLARVLRLPGTRNHKSDPPTPVSLIHDGGARYPVDAFRAHALPAPKPKPSAPSAGASAPLTDAEVVRLAERAGNGAKFGALYYRGDLSGHGDDESRADEALLCLIAFYTREPDQIERIFSGSALGQREKWRDRADYRERSIAAALELVTETYEPSPEPIVIKTGGRTHDNGEHQNGTSGAPPRGHPAPDGGGDAGGDEWTAETTETEMPLFALTDMGNAERLIYRNTGNIRYCPELKSWVIWQETKNPDGTTRAGQWVRDEESIVFTLAQQTIRGIYDEAENQTESELRKAVAKHAIRSEQTARIQALVTQAQWLPGVPISTDALDRDAWLLNAANGTIDLRTGALRAPRKDDFITRMVPIAFDPAAPRATWDAFLASIFVQPGAAREPAPELITYVHRLCGYAVTGDPRERVLPILWGGGRNGKTTILETICDTLGTGYAGSIDADVLYSKRDDSRNQHNIAELWGMRFVITVEGGEGQKLDSALVKRITGRDTLKGRFLYKNQFSFTPTHVIFFGTNHRPRVTDSTSGVWDRLRLVPFNARFYLPEDPEWEQAAPWQRADLQLDTKLKAERAGILAWLVEGAVAYAKHGIKAPELMTRVTDDYKAEEDLVGRFVGECCLALPTAFVAFKTLYEAYATWHRAFADGDPMTERTFAIRLTEKGFATGTAGTGGTKYRVRRGLRVRDGTETADAPPEPPSETSTEETLWN